MANSAFGAVSASVAVHEGSSDPHDNLTDVIVTQSGNTTKALKVVGAASPTEVAIQLTEDDGNTNVIALRELAGVPTLQFGTDTTIFRSAANKVRTDDTLSINGGEIAGDGSGTLYVGTGAVAIFLQGLAALTASTTSIPSLRIPHGTAPSSPSNGDMWTTTAGLFVRINGVTRSVNVT